MRRQTASGGDQFSARPVKDDDGSSKSPGDSKRGPGRHPSSTEGARANRHLVRRRIAAAKGVAALLLLGLFVIFVIRNSQPVVVDFVFALGRPRLIWVILGCAAVGGVIGYFLGGHDYVPKGKERRTREARNS